MKLIRVIKQTIRVRESIGLFYCEHCQSEVERTIRNGERTKSCGCLQKKGGIVELDERHYLGQRCKHGHEYQDTGKTLRFRATKGCVICSRQHNRENSHKFQSAYNKHDRADAALNCSRYQECLNRIKKDKDFKMNCQNCPDFEYKENCYQAEIKEDYFYRNAFGEHSVNMR